MKIMNSKDKQLQSFLDRMSICDVNIKNFKHKDKLWMNPYNQGHIKSGYFTKQDFIDFMNGEGKCIEGDTNVEKKLRFDLVIWCENNEANLIEYHYNFFHLVKESSPIKTNPLDYYQSRKLSNLNNLNNYDCNNVIKNAFARHIPSFIDDLNYIKEENLRKSWNTLTYGIIATLVDMGIGYIGAINTPEQIENLSWYKELVWEYIFYKNLKLQNLTKPIDDYFLFKRNPKPFLRKYKINQLNNEKETTN
jgi:hypothetical protein